MLLILLLPVLVFAGEPGLLKTAPYFSGVVLADKFIHGRGLRDYEVQTLHYNRVACERRLFTQSGKSLEGEADVKATNIGSDLTEVEFPMYVNFGSFNSVNPFGNGVESLETMSGRRLIKTTPWKEQPLLITKQLTVRFEQGPPKLVDSVAEVRVMEESYPSTYIIKETIKLPKPFSVYFICR